MTPAAHGHAEFSADDHGVATHRPYVYDHTADATMNSGVHDGSVCGATRISPGSKDAIWAMSWITRARPRAIPAEAGCASKDIARAHLGSVLR